MFAGLILLSIGLGLTALTPMLPPPWYNQAALTAELSGVTSMRVTHDIAITLPPDVAEQFITAPAVSAAVSKFEQDWENAFGRRTL